MGDTEAASVAGTSKEEQSNEEDYKALYEQEVKAGAGKDKKVSELLAKIKQIEEDKTKKVKEEKRAARKDMSVETLQAEYENEIEQLRRDYEKEIEKKEAEHKEIREKDMIYSVASKLDNVPSIIVKLLTLPKGLNADEMREVIQDAAEEINTNKFVMENTRRVASRPRTGDSSISKAVEIPTEDEWGKMSQTERDTWAKNATKEQRKIFQDRSLSR